jgi:hypothetical protein
MELGVFSNGQMVRAARGWWLRRNGLKSGKITGSSYYIKTCPAQSLRRGPVALRSLLGTRHPDSIIVPRDLPSLSKRQLATELGAFCDSADLVIPNYQFSTLAETGLYQPDSPAIAGAPTSGPPPDLDVGDGTDAGGAKSNFESIRLDVQSQVDNTGGKIVADSSSPPVPSSLASSRPSVSVAAPGQTVRSTATAVSTPSGGGSSSGSASSRSNIDTVVYVSSVFSLAGCVLASMFAF